MKVIRSAAVKEAELLSDLAARSEAYWGYDAAYMNKFKEFYSVSEDYILKNPVYVLESDEILIGFYGLIINSEETSLEYLFIDPKYIGQGYGKELWEHMIEECKRLGIKEFTIVTSPQAKGFYLGLGAVFLGEVESLILKGRMIPQFIYRI